jgi:hypothetical protein
MMSHLFSREALCASPNCLSQSINLVGSWVSCFAEEGERSSGELLDVCPLVQLVDVTDEEKVVEDDLL